MLAERGIRDRVDGRVAVLVGLGVLAELLPVADEVAPGDVHHACVQVEVGPLQPAQFAAAGAGDRRQSQVHRQRRIDLVSCGDDLSDGFWSGRGGWAVPGLGQLR